MISGRLGGGLRKVDSGMILDEGMSIEDDDQKSESRIMRRVAFLVSIRGKDTGRVLREHFL